MKPLPGYPRVLDLAAEWAAKLHADKGQTYSDGQPYAVHLQDVDAVLVRYGFNDPANPVHQCLRVAAHFHDLLEDTDVSPVTIRVLQGPDVLALVEAVTNEPGPNRAARHEATYPKTRAAGPWAVVLKVADRVANVEASAGTRFMGMYRTEHPAFRLALYQPEEPSEAMWAHLDQLFKQDSASALATEPQAASVSAQKEVIEPQAWIL